MPGMLLKISPGERGASLKISLSLSEPVEVALSSRLRARVTPVGLIRRRRARAGVGDLMAEPWLKDILRFVYPFLSTDGRTLANFGDSSPAFYWAPTMTAFAARGAPTGARPRRGMEVAPATKREHAVLFAKD